ncbi:ABC transporter permease [Actinomadura sp. HBU206391]|uniref:ABC transporter permease n=1 Tax=Actinomadura sp. HBU206391 TaxID=2731692 RepID=UPI001650A737|nr:ABC transporter permease [Actinomadura sp. HBU206391]MBC6458568.1 ABC transporter permease [Actinomadura sp. HBU206391]
MTTPPISSAPSAPASAIHDIGYRHYEGRRLGRAYVLRSLYVHNLRAVFGLGRPARAKVMPFMLAAIMMLPAAGSVAVLAITKEPETLIPYANYAIIMQPVVAIFLATQAPVVASRELRFHVVPLYFSRPVGSFDFVLAKFAAFVTALFALLATPVTLLYIGALVTRPSKEADAPQLPSIGSQTLDFLPGLAGCALFALVLAAFALVVAAFTPRRGFGVAAVIAVYLLSTATVGIVQAIAEETSNYGVAGWAGLFAPFTLVDGVQVSLLGTESPTIGGPPAGAGGPVFCLVCAAVIAGSLAVLYGRFRKGGLS